MAKNGVEKRTKKRFFGCDFCFCFVKGWELSSLECEVYGWIEEIWGFKMRYRL
jgi:hypothetical protein